MSAAVAAISSVSKTFGERHVLLDISFSIGPCETLAIMGPNGVGKSTLANIVSGVDSEFSGVLTRQPGSARECPMVQQDFRASLLPWLSLEANIAFPLLLRGVPAGERARAVTEILSRAPARLDASTPVSKLSGGQAQLACVLRGFIARPNLLVCDEPFSAIDYPARIMLRSLIASMCAEYGTSLLFVSHSIEDTVFLADRIVVLSGRPASIAEVISVPNKGSRDNAWLDGEGSADVRRQVRAALDRA